jgi:hypothetical protein
MHKIIEIILLLFDAFLIDLSEAQLSHHELSLLLPCVTLSLRPRRHGVTPLQLIACDIQVVDLSFE